MPLPQSKAVTLIACLAITGAIAGLWFEFRSPTQRVDRTPIIALNTGLGQVLVEETVKAMHDKGNIVLVNGYNPDQPGLPKDDCWTVFHQELQKHSAIHILATEIIPPDPGSGPLPGCSPKVLSALLEKYGHADVIVFFFRLPEWAQAEPLIAQSITSKIIAIDGDRLTLRREYYAGYFSSGILAALIGLRNDSDTRPATEPRTPREWFDGHYQVYTPQNYESLP